MRFAGVGSRCVIQSSHRPRGCCAADMLRADRPGRQSAAKKGKAGAQEGAPKGSPKACRKQLANLPLAGARRHPVRPRLDRTLQRPDQRRIQRAHDRRHQVVPEVDRRKETGVLAPPERAQLATNSKAVQERVGWAMVDDKVTGAQLGLPTKQVPRIARRPAAARAGRPRRGRSRSRPSGSGNRARRLRTWSSSSAASRRTASSRSI